MPVDQRIRIELTSGFDENYLPHFCVLLEALRQYSGRHQLVMHALHTAIPASRRNAVDRHFPDIEINWYSVDRDHPALRLAPLIHISSATYLRLLTDVIVDVSVDRLLYLDVDMSIAQDVLPLWQIDLDGYSLAATLDQGISNEDLATFKRMYNLSGDALYFNAGVLLLDLGRIREVGEFKQALDLLTADRDRYALADQDALNVVFWQRWKTLPAKWNFQRSLLYADTDIQGDARLRRDVVPAIVHFTGSQKPWTRDEWHPYAWLYLKQLRKSVFRAEIEAKGGIGPRTYVKALLRYLLRVKLMRGTLRRRA
ncbi:MAG: glycosyltransferase family 8 protein [Erythrobacter sp.]|nr:glycosyltransferase family 8 protein [Erythrobacter sp.]